MIRVSARQANQDFSKLLDRAAKGEEVIITRRGVPVARLVPHSARPAMTPERQAAIDRLFGMLEKGYRLGGRRFTRDEMHER